jgi:hypothetical protein
MITGYNTDVKHEERVFHVQTEDKGTSNPYIETLIYVGGQVLAAERTSYADLAQNGFDRGAVSEIMDRQHQKMIGAIKAGELQEKVRQLFGTGEVKKPVVEADEPSKDDPSERTLDEVILEYLTTEAQQDHLTLFLDEEVELTVGQRTAVTVRASSSKSGMPVANAQITAKMISTADQPRILSAGCTTDDGTLQMALDIPNLVEGTSALIITADSNIGKAELKYLL